VPLGIKSRLRTAGILVGVGDKMYSDKMYLRKERCERLLLCGMGSKGKKILVLPDRNKIKIIFMKEGAFIQEPALLRKQEHFIVSHFVKSKHVAAIKPSSIA